MPGPDADNPVPGERSPFQVAGMMERLESFLTRYGAVHGGARFGNSELIRAAVDRLHAIAAWTEEFARGKSASPLVGHAAMYRGHARWLGSWSR
jgi:hypothetical protein